jgi:alkylresorcinol/alkylpyrone synthase
MALAAFSASLRAMHFLGLGTAVPARRWTQAECWDALRGAAMFAALTPRSQAICRKVFNGQNGIAARHLTYERLEEAFDVSPDALHARFARHAPALAAQAARQALADAGLDTDDVDALLVSTCTGYLCPGLTSHVGEALGLRPEVHALDLVGQGCGAALPNLRTAAALLAAGAARRALCVCVEVCSAAFYLDDDPGVLVSNCLFGDGAAAAIVGREAPAGRRRVRWLEAETVCRPEDRDYLRFETRGGRLRNILAPQVPALAAKHAEAVLAAVLARRGLRRQQLAAWILHAGGREVLAELQAKLGTPAADVARSAAVLRGHGNLSSPFVLFVLRDALAAAAPGGRWWMASFGAGFTSHGALLEVE